MQQTASKIEMSIDVFEAFEPLLEPYRYKVFYGGRGGAKSWEFTDALIMYSICGKELILCTREYQASIADSVYRLLLNRIQALGLLHCFKITQTSIKSITGSEFIFKGLHHNIMEIKSLEGVTKCWVEEAQSVSSESWEVLIPTIRREGSEIWISFNTGEEDDPTYTRFVLNPPPDSVVRKVGWQDNPYFPEVLNKERLYLKSVDPEAYEHIWEGFPRKLTEACIFKGKYEIKGFTTPPGVRFYYGADWGFGPDPSGLWRCFIEEDCLYIDYESVGYGVDLEDLPDLFDRVPRSREWTIRADNSRPEMIRFMKKKGFNVIPAVKKWAATNVEDKSGKQVTATTESSIKDGIAYLRRFKKIYIHERCKHMIDEAKFYSYKVDKLTKEVLPIIVDKWNHGWDSIRYALEPLIKGGVDWESLIE